MASFILLITYVESDSNKAYAAYAMCLGSKAKIVNSQGTVYVKRKESVLLTGKKVTVKAKGDSKICSTTGDINVYFEKGSRNMASLGSGNNTITLNQKASKNIIRTGDGNNTITIRAKASINDIQTGSGDDKVTIAAKSNKTIINAGDGNNRITYAAKANIQDIKTGIGNDIIKILSEAKTNNRTIRASLGDDVVSIEARGHTKAYLSEVANPDNVRDTDRYYGGSSNDTVYDYHGGNDDNPNMIFGYNGFDKLYSLGDARSNIYGGDGTDWIYAASAGDSGDRIFGERGNDRMEADKGGVNAKGAYLDGGEGDDWYYGTSGDDIIIALSGIKKIYAGAGNDKIIKTGDGIGTIEGGSGDDAISYIGHTPPGYWKYSGVMIDLSNNKAMNGKGIDTIKEMETIVGSPFDDLITGKSGSVESLSGGAGDDQITGQGEDYIDGGLGVNECSGNQNYMSKCNRDSPGPRDESMVEADIGVEGVLTVLGSYKSDVINVSYSELKQAYEVKSSIPISTAGMCSLDINDSSLSICPAEKRSLSFLTVDGNKGNDNITVDYSVPEEVSTVLSGGEGNNVIYGGKTGDMITAKGEGANVLDGRDGSDRVYLIGNNSKAIGGPGSDAIHIKESPCKGGTADGSSGKDGLVFAGSPEGINANLTNGTARWNRGYCKNPAKLRNIDSLEGSKYNDTLTGKKRGYGKTGFLGRDGIDTFYSKNGVKDSIITGPGGKKNKIIRDKFDEVVYGWGLAAY